MDPESSSISIFPIYNRPGFVERWGEDKVLKYESLLLQAKNQVRKYYVPPKPKPPRPVGADPFSFESDDEESDDDDESFVCHYYDGENDEDSHSHSHSLTVGEINKWDREDYSLVVTRPLSGTTQRYTCIWSGGVASFTEDFIGFMWVAVHSMNSICVATRIHDLNDECSRRMLISGKRPVLSRLLFQKGLIGKAEGFVDRRGLPRRHLHQIMKKPFGVVSLISSTDVHQETGDDAIEASGGVEYLKEKLKSGSDLDTDETIQTAISALQHQCNQEFTADDIWVCVVHEGVDMCLQRREIEEHLPKINNPTTKPLEDDEIEANEIEEQVYVAVRS